jgi:hypothetical protein
MLPPGKGGGDPLVKNRDPPGTPRKWFEAIPGEQLCIRVHGTQVNGRYAIMENIAAPGTATPMHFHAEDEIFHILEGTKLERLFEPFYTTNFSLRNSRITTMPLFDCAQRSNR